ncbi:MAG: hypothetical protein ABSB91_06165 [Sedimentisphaerales bacterium]|jgi:hypothetical protein
MSVKTIRLLILVVCGLLAGCSIVDFFKPEGKPSNQKIYETYRQIALKKSNAADVLTLFDKPDYALLSQSKSIIALAGDKKKGYKMWFDMVAFEENELYALRKYVFISDEKPRQLFVQPWEGVYYDCQMVLSKKVLDEPYANENARRIAILKQVGEDSRRDAADVGADNKDIAICGMVIGQAIDAARVKLDESPALATKLNRPSGLEFTHPGYDKGVLMMVADGDTVTLHLALGSFAKKWKLSLEKKIKEEMQKQPKTEKQINESELEGQVEWSPNSLLENW